MMSTIPYADMETRELREHRVLVEQQLAAAKRTLAIETARAEQREIERAGGEKALGTNEAARERALVLALALDETLDRCREGLASDVLALALIDAELESRADEQRLREREQRLELDKIVEQRRTAEYAQRGRLLDLLERLADAGALSVSDAISALNA